MKRRGGPLPHRFPTSRPTRHARDGKVTAVMYGRGIEYTITGALSIGALKIEGQKHERAGCILYGEIEIHGAFGR